MSLAELFPDGDYRFHLTLRRGAPREFFRTQSSPSLLAERTRWLAEAPARYAALQPEGAPLLDEFAALLAEWGVMDAGIHDGEGTPAKLLRLGRELEPDFLLLSPDGEKKFRLRGGALCFPTGWALEEKIGHTLDFIHGVVPGLNAALASPISQFLARLRPGPAFLRDNWGIAATDGLNLHPSRGVAAPSLPAPLDTLWLRVEHQALLALPESHGVVFGIRLALHRLDEVAAQPETRVGLRRALATMPDEMARYKGLTAIRADLIRDLS